jgi:hypothetical protein
VKEKYPKYFANNIMFNSVLHNRNSYDSIVRFFKETFNTQPSIAELNPMNIKADYIHEFSEILNALNFVYGVQIGIRYNYIALHTGIFTFDSRKVINELIPKQFNYAESKFILGEIGACFYF